MFHYMLSSTCLQRGELYVLIFGCAGSLLLHGLFSSCGKQGLLSSCDAQVSHCGVSLVTEYRLNRCGARAQLLCSMWDLSASGIELIFPTLVGGFFSLGPPGKPKGLLLISLLVVRSLAFKIYFDFTIITLPPKM